MPDFRFDLDLTINAPTLAIACRGIAEAVRGMPGPLPRHVTGSFHIAGPEVSVSTDTLLRTSVRPPPQGDAGDGAGPPAKPKGGGRGK